MQQVANPRIGGRVQEGADAQILIDGEAGKDTASLRYDSYAVPRNLVGGYPGYLNTVDPDMTASNRGQSHHAAGQGRFPDPIAAKEGDDLPLRYGQGDTVNDW